MIGSIRGKIIFKNDKFLIVDVSGVGYKINLSLDTLSKLKKPAEPARNASSIADAGGPNFLTKILLK
jgi:Holliday junction resolvasome RuvABC DNA-binding subunit